ncbi:protein-disulfide reductase DsbD family protein [Kordiimonas aquimaris]|uniref:protein-disulfide reductase DsbD family protein n=1 Tax=Kordiimonas aquimaris TaxID=707591 RepID=UPI0021D08464|nr:protein-disulfide reductase DsbD domain-containing protein [Kordiimonas aquimaris]
MRELSKKTLTLATVLLGITGAFSNAVTATDLGTVEASHSKATLISEYSSAAAGETIWVGLELTPREGWHSYWKNYGDSGAAPIFEWVLPEGVTAGDALYPTPHRMPIGPLMNYGYEAPSTLLVPLTFDSGYTANALPIELIVEWLVCEIECVPQEGTWSGSLPVGDLSYDEGARSFFTDARDQLPEMAIWTADLTVYPAQSRLKVYAGADEIGTVKEAYFYPEGEGITEYAAAQQWASSPDGFFVDMVRTEGGLEANSGKGILVITSEDDQDRAYEIDAELKVEALPAAGSSNATPPQVNADFPLWQAGLFALLGGLVLNLMPCVFPVLSLKAFSFIAANSKTAGERKQEGWAYTAGIWVSFMIIVSALLIIKSSGTAIGWGFQLQEPAFVGALVLIMVLVALSLSGMFNIQVGVEGAGQQLASQDGNKGAFFQGVLATLVATPCTAPLMAPAIGFALTQSAPVVFLIFSLLAFGLALPFLALSYSPALARLMPRPGPWMEKLKEALAFPMYLTAAWLLYVFTLQAGATATLALLVAIIIAIFGVWLWQAFSGRVGKAIAVIIMISAASAIIIQPFGGSPVSNPVETASDITPYTEEALAELLADDETVFAYFSAEWCITCKVNEQVALFTDETQALFAQKGIRVMKGDWTNRNAEIAEILARYGRAGVPLYLLFPKGQSEAIVLPEILTPGIVADAIANI